MTNPISSVKRKLDCAIQQLCSVSWMFVKDPSRDFTRNRKLSFRTVISILLSMEDKSLNSELLSFFGCLPNIPSASAFIQQGAKISKEAFSSLFDLFVRLTDYSITYKGYRLLAADGSDIQIPTDKNDADSYFPGSIDQAPYNLLHLNAVYICSSILTLMPMFTAKDLWTSVLLCAAWLTALPSLMLSSLPTGALRLTAFWLTSKRRIGNS